MTISNRLNRRRNININNNNGDNSNTADTELLLAGTTTTKSTESSASGRIKRARRLVTAVKMTALNQQATDDMTTKTTRTTRELHTDSATMNGNAADNGSARISSKFLPGKSLKYERLINQPKNAGTTAIAKTLTKAIDGMTSEAALNTNGNEWPPQQQQQQHWRLQDEATAALSSWHDAHSSSTPATATTAAAMRNWQAHSEGAETHLSPAVNGVDVVNANAKAPAKMRSRRANGGSGGHSWSGNYQQQHPHTPQPQPTTTTPTTLVAGATIKPTLSTARTQSQTVNNGGGGGGGVGDGGGFGNMTGNGNSYVSGNNVKYFGNGVDYNGASASDTVTLLSALPTEHGEQQQPTTNWHSNSANLTRSTKGFYYSAVDDSVADFDANYTSQAPSASESPLYYSSAASSARSASSPAAFYMSNGATSSSPSRSGSGSGSAHGSSSAAVALACNCCSNLIARCCFGIPLLKAINVRRCVLALFAITVVTIFYYTHYVDTGVFVGLIQRDTRPSPLINCRMVSGKHTRESSRAPDHRSEARLRIDPKVLVFVETTYSGLGRDIAELLVYNRIKYKIEVAGKSLPVLTNLDKGRYGVIVFENLDKYLNMDKWNRELLDKYCREYSVGIVGFVSPSEETLVAAQLRGFPLYIHTNLRLRDASLNPASPVLRLTRAGETAWGALPGDDWAVFQHNHTTYEPVEWAQRNTQDFPSDSGGQVQLPLTTVLQDHGHFDGIQRVFFGSSLRFWLHRLLFLDALSYLSHGQLSLSLERMILVDIDDIFVGERGTRLRPDDVQALIATQRIIASMVPGFRFNLGFSGKFYHHGEREENLGDDYLLRNVQEFNWFSHMWKHQQPHLYDNLTLLMSEMQLNYAFAKEHNIPTDSGYSISPHHSGVYPAHEILYIAWKNIWNVKVTSTEEYPHLRPARLRRGFIHRDIMVLPRQTCGLFTHTMYIDRYPGGRDKLDESIQGGELFQTIVYNPINIFMTHMSNYGSDRLALYTFQSVIKFLQCWTNLKLSSAPPIQLAEMYFRLHPEEVDPVWGNPCDDPRHKKIWSKKKSCDSLPKFLVIGPQKTGTTALYTFLSMHSSITSNIPSPDTFEEIQFFNGNNYYRGLDWYMDFFPSDSNGNTTVATPTRYMFEKSATYFDGEAVPKRAHALLPHAKIVSILISPAKRAYSWYQHQRAHGDAIANNYSFYQVNGIPCVIRRQRVAGKSLPVLTNLDKGRYGVIVFENLDKYLNMDKWNRELLDKYCREYSVGIVGFVSPSEETLVAAQLRGFPLYIHTNLRLRDASLNPASPVLRLTRAGETAWGALPGDDWAVFQHNHTTYEPVEWAQRNTQDFPSDSGGQVQLPLTTVLQDHGHFDGIQRVFFGSSLRFWLHRLLFLDALSYLSHGQLSLSLERMILVDIDDIFVGERGTRLRPDDVQALIATQRIIASMVPGFRFNLGFSGKFYHHGEREENLGDDYLLRNVQEFNWFSHMWKHQQPHLYDNLTLLMSEMQLNYAFAKEHNIPTDSGYSISPHHSGVYPAHEILYIAWKNIWNVKVTSTEEYPHLRPARLRRGFIHRDIMVLPRQTCGLFTHTMYIDRYPGGRDKLDESIQGGELFQTIVYNPINIFMTHMSNYGSDRLALYTFQSVIKFLQCWTNLKLSSAPPIQLAEMYFRLHPEEVDPVWGNPCDDPRHKKIWSKKKSCDSLPKFLVIGPQKTGTTALYTFLSMHSSITSNIPSPDTFEEIQFFNGNNYYRGLDWYMDFFPSDSNGNTTVATPTRYMFEKSATYFDGEAVPKRAHALLPHAKIVSILISPAKRAYSWYQHQRAHGDAIANNYSFYQVITASDSAPKALKDLRNRCLNPGKYAQHLEHWLAYYPAQQLHIIDGEQLRLNPVDVMNDLQRFLKIQPTLDYSNHLRFDAKKGFFCQALSEKRNKCLGKSKGRQYPSMDERSAKLLQRYYLSHNTALVKLLKKLGSRPIPQWLKDDLSTGT